jgi:hypothetical protein
MLLNNPNPRMTKKTLAISNIGHDLALAINYVVKTWFQKNLFTKTLHKAWHPRK